ncbi:MAG: DMT family transporter [Oscillospiraceae bacterium]|nr:DMT family transporter [Oscillospiraceae bacterium]
MTRKQDSPALGYISVLATALLWSTGGLFIKLVPWSGLSINAARCAVAFLFKIITRHSIKLEFNKYTITGGLAMAATTTLFAYANKLTTSANAIMLQYSFPMFLILIICITCRTRPKTIDIVTSIIITLGVFFCCLDDMGSGGLFGNALALVSGLTFALYFFINANEHSKPDDANCIGFLISFLIGFPALISEQDYSIMPLLYILILGAIQLGLAYRLLEYGIKRIPAVSASFISTIEPVMNPIWVAIFYHEKVGIYAVIGSVLVISATLFYSVFGSKSAQGV